MVAGLLVKDRQIHFDKMSIGEYGFIALVYDTEGNLIGLHSMKLEWGFSNSFNSPAFLREGVNVGLVLAAAAYVETI